MRRIFAIILLIPMATLFVGAMRISTICAPDQPCPLATHPTTCQASHPNTCQPAAHPNTCHNANCEGCQKSEHDNGKKDRYPCCFDCPLCTLVTLNPFIVFELSPGATITEYAVMPVNNLPDYYQHHWKPPAAAVIS